MPQLDKVTFLSQFFWLCVFFLGFYVVCLKYFLPQMSRILKYRQKRLDMSNQGVGTAQEENDKVRMSTDRLLEDGIKHSRHVLKQNLERTDNWILDSIKQTNETRLKDTNGIYLYSLGERNLSQNLSLQASWNDFSGAIFLSVLLQKLKRLKASGSPTSATRSQKIEQAQPTRSGQRGGKKR